MENIKLNNIELYCREAGIFNESVYGYNYVTRIPAGAASLEIR
jgi:hypothetical protein